MAKIVFQHSSFKLKYYRVAGNTYAPKTVAINDLQVILDITVKLFSYTELSLDHEFSKVNMIFNKRY